MAAKWINPARAFDVTPTQSNVLVSVVNYANADTRLAWPAIGRIMWDTGYTRKTVKRALHCLVDLGILVVDRRHTPTFPTVYRFDPDADVPRKEPYEPDRRQQGPQGPPIQGSDIPEQGSLSPEQGSDVPGTGVTDTPKPSLTVNEPSMNRHQPRMTNVETINTTGSESPGAWFVAGTAKSKHDRHDTNLRRSHRSEADRR